MSMKSKKFIVSLISRV